MLVVILIYDQLLFRPLVAWADRFRIDSEQSEEQPQSWALTMLSPLAPAGCDRPRRSTQMMRWSYQLAAARFRAARPPRARCDSRVRATSSGTLVLAVLGALRRLAHL